VHAARLLAPSSLSLPSLAPFRRERATVWALSPEPFRWMIGTGRRRTYARHVPSRKSEMRLEVNCLSTPMTRVVNWRRNLKVSRQGANEISGRCLPEC
jgi:hypothetical protein